MAGRARLGLATTMGAALLAGHGLVGVSAAAPATHVTRIAHVKHEGATISLRRTAHGRVLVGANGHSIYTFTSDTRNHSNCRKSCRKQWPPVTVKGKPHAGAGVSARHLGVIKGRRQVTYYGHPLYTYFKDTKAGQVKGDVLFKFGGYWYLSSAKGGMV